MQLAKYFVLILIGLHWVANGQVSAPQQIKISMLKPSDRVVSFVSLPTPGFNPPNGWYSFWEDIIANNPPVLWYGFQSDVLNNNLSMSFRYNLSGIREIWNGAIMGFHLDHVIPTRYYYKIHFINETEVFHFDVLPYDEPVSKVIRIAAIGDVGTYPPAFQTIARLSEWRERDQLDLIIHAGDISYAGLRDYSTNNQSISDAYGRMIQPVAAYVPYMTAPGNHEQVEWDFIPYTGRYIMPGPYWYALPIGNVLLLSFSTEHDYQVGSPQRVWLEEQLKNSSQYDYRILFAHKPMYSTGKYTTDSEVFRLYIEYLLIKYRVDLFIAGHVHTYERSYPLNQKIPMDTRSGDESDPYINPCYPIHVITGGGGWELNRPDEFWEVKPPWFAYRMIKFGYSLMEVFPNRSLHYTLHFNDGTVGDSFWIHKSANYTCTFPSRNSKDEESNAKLIGGLVGGIIAIVAVVVMLVIAVYLRKKSYKPAHNRRHSDVVSLKDLE